MGQSITIQELIAQAYLNLHADIASDSSLALTRKEHQDLEKDFDVITRRFKSEGISFVTDRLPAFGKGVEQLIEANGSDPYADNAHVVSHHFEYWKTKGSHPRFPYFLSTLIKRAVRGCSGSFRAIRQICFLFYKIELPRDPEKDLQVVRSFMETEDYLSTSMTVDSHPLFDEAAKLFTRVISSVDLVNIRGKHGPGAVSTGERMFDKWNGFKFKYESVHRVYPCYTYYPAGSIQTTGAIRHLTLLENVKEYKSMTTLSFPVSKVCLVPKDSRGPRLICIEPMALQFLQQGAMANMVKTIESHHLTKGRVNFTDQTVNQRLALSNSSTRTLATIDLKDASDRVSLRLLRALCQNKGQLGRLEALRSHKATSPLGEVHLHKYAAMGSALCFPVLALVVWSISAATVVGNGGRIEDVYVYGDDLIIPSNMYDLVVCALESADLKVNTGKSFVKSFFRESCGVDAYHGVDVTPVKIKKLPPQHVKDLSAIVSWIAYTDHFREKGYAHLSSLFRSVVEAVTGSLPDTPYDLGFLSFRGRWSFPIGNGIHLGRDNKPRLLCWTVKSKPRKADLTGYPLSYMGLTEYHGGLTSWRDLGTCGKREREEVTTRGVLVRRWKDLSFYLTIGDIYLISSET